MRILWLKKIKQKGQRLRKKIILLKKPLYSTPENTQLA